MKKSLLLTLCMVCCLTISYSQTLIPKIGGSLSTVALSDELKFDEEDIKTKLGLVVGVALELPLSGKFYIQPELLFHQKGYKSELSDGTGSLTYKGNLNYIELPVMFKYSFGMFYLNAGPSIAYGIGGNYKAKVTTPGLSKEQSGKIKFGDMPDNYDGKDDYVDNALDIGVQLGGGIKIADKIIIDLRYGLGLSNLVDEDSDNGLDDNKSKNRSLQLTIGYPISFGK